VAESHAPPPHQAEPPAVASERRSGSGIGIFVLGVVIGAGLALLYAPHSGPEMRRKVARGARRVRRKARDLATSAQDTAQDAARSTREALERRLARHHETARDELYDGEDEGV
jgi:gas vesicle protein